MAKAGVKGWRGHHWQVMQGSAVTPPYPPPHADHAQSMALRHSLSSPAGRAAGGAGVQLIGMCPARLGTHLLARVKAPGWRRQELE